ncbi:hypothetical protein [uncultured Shewanella sp.]|uniref:hypothetical protein n=1 Tax=uncultured Shewanella sp. TaxID=173975 RepID=UPI0026032C13|nr:hypothetical protein [uncultured Shewanella sp.]
MPNVISQAVFAVTEFRAGASSLTVQATKNKIINCYRDKNVGFNIEISNIHLEKIDKSLV